MTFRRRPKPGGLQWKSRDALNIVIVGINYAPEPTGIAPYTTGLAEGLVAKGHRVRVLTSFPHYPYWSFRGNVPRTAKSLHNGVQLERHRHYVPAAPGSANRALFELAFGARVAMRAWGRPDVLVCISPGLLSSAVVFTRAHLSRRRPALGLIIQDIYSSGMTETGVSGGFLARVMTGVEKRTTRSADGVAVIHERFATQIATRFGINRERIEVIRNWTHVKSVAPFDRPAFRRAMGWYEDEIIVLHAGAMGKKQGLEKVIEAAEWAESHADPVRFVLLGEGSQRTLLEARAKGVKRVHFLHHLDDMDFTRTLSAADILLVNERPGVREMAVPSKLTTYFNAAKPVLAATEADSTTAAELAISNAGIVVPPGVPEALVNGALLIAADPEAAERMGERGHRYAVEVLSSETAMDAFDRWIRKLAQRGEGPPPTNGNSPGVFAQSRRGLRRLSSRHRQSAGERPTRSPRGTSGRPSTPRSCHDRVTATID